MADPRKSHQARERTICCSFTPVRRAGRRQRTTARAPSEIASPWPLGILRHRVLSISATACANFSSRSELTLECCDDAASSASPGQRSWPCDKTFRICDGVMANSFLSRVPSSLISDPGANKNMRLKRSDRAAAPARASSLPDDALGSAQFAKRGVPALAAFRRKTGDPPDPGQRSVEIFLDDHTVNVRKLLGDLDQGLA